MKAAVYYGRHDVRISDFQEPLLTDTGVKVAVSYCGLCGTDLHKYDGRGGSRPVIPPVVLGHEASGIVVETGRDVTSFHKGDRVTVDPNWSCGHCSYCKEGMTHMCENSRGVVKGFAQYICPPQENVYHIPDTLSLKHAALAEPLSCCLHGMDLLDVHLGDHVLIIGMGSIGSMMVQLCRLAGAAHIVVVEPQQDKKEQAMQLGATMFLSPDEDVVQILQDNKIHIKKVMECVGLTATMENAFRYALPTIENGYGFDYNMCYSEEARAKGVVVGWEPKEREETIYHYPSYGGDLIANDAAPGTSTQGVNGSMARFSIYGKSLYTVEQNIMCVFDLSGDKPVLTTNDIWLQRDVETLFNYKDKMFMGTPTGMLIYSLEDPLAPKYRSSVSHVFGCDPVVVEDDLAYVTVHSGNTCGQNTNELMLIDVSDVDQPNLLVTYGMKCPKGLGIDNGTLFLCDEGLKVFNTKDAMTLMANQLVHYAGMEGYDVIPFKNTLMMIADDGLYQYDYSNLQAISQLSKLPMGE